MKKLVLFLVLSFVVSFGLLSFAGESLAYNYSNFCGFYPDESSFSAMCYNLNCSDQSAWPNPFNEHAPCNCMNCTASTEAQCRDFQCQGQVYTWDDPNCVCGGSQVTPGTSGTPQSSGSQPADTNIGPPWGGPDVTVSDVIENVTNWVLALAGSLAVLFIIIGGIRYITSAGNPQLQEAAKKTLTQAIVGLVIVLVSYLIVTVVMRVITSS